MPRAPASSSPSAPSRPLASPRSTAPDPIDQEALELLARRVIPRLGRDHRNLEKIVRSVVKHQRLAELGTRPERDRRDLLAVLEEQVAASRGKESPSAVVRLTNILSAIPVVDDPLGRWRTAPAR
jgi:hypothetical protein